MCGLRYYNRCEFPQDCVNIVAWGYTSRVGQVAKCHISPIFSKPCLKLHTNPRNCWCSKVLEICCITALRAFIFKENYTIAYFVVCSYSIMQLPHQALSQTHIVPQKEVFCAFRRYAHSTQCAFQRNTVC